jgi:peptidoglycan hydrolase-like protein with peptidoglycan-binding domain
MLQMQIEVLVNKHSIQTIMPATNITNDPTLQLGASGTKVQELQKLLNLRLPHDSQLKIDGVFGPTTQNGVTIVQYQFLLKQDGIVGDLTWKALRANAPVGRPALRLGSKSEDVKRVQLVLQTTSYYNGAADGNFGSATEAAVKAFQKDNKLSADGIVGDKTWNALSGAATFFASH